MPNVSQKYAKLLSTQYKMGKMYTNEQIQKQFDRLKVISSIPPSWWTKIKYNAFGGGVLPRVAFHYVGSFM